GQVSRPAVAAPRLPRRPSPRENGRMTRVPFAAPLVAVILTGVAAAAGAAEYVVSTAGDDAATGLAGAPWRTIQRALRAVKPGDTVTVEVGTYAGLACDGTSGTAASRIVLRARN